MIETHNNLLTNRHQILQSLPRNWEQAKGQTLYWRQPKRFKNTYYLHSQEHVVGSINFEGTHFIRRGIAKTNKTDFRFKFSRFSLPKVTISSAERILAEVILETNWGWYGNLDLPGGYQYIWKPAETHKNQYFFSDIDGYPVVIFKPRLGFFKLESQVEIDSPVFHNPYLPMLTMLGWFLILLKMS